MSTQLRKDYERVFGIIVKLNGEEEWTLAGGRRSALYKTLRSARARYNILIRDQGWPADRIKIVSYQLQDEVIYG